MTPTQAPYHDTPFNGPPYHPTMIHPTMAGPTMARSTTARLFWVDGMRRKAPGPWTFQEGSNPTMNGVIQWNSGDYQTIGRRLMYGSTRL